MKINVIHIKFLVTVFRWKLKIMFIKLIHCMENTVKDTNRHQCRLRHSTVEGRETSTKVRVVSGTYEHNLLASKLVAGIRTILYRSSVNWKTFHRPFAFNVMQIMIIAFLAYVNPSPILCWLAFSMDLEARSGKYAFPG